MKKAIFIRETAKGAMQRCTASDAAIIVIVRAVLLPELLSLATPWDDRLEAPA
jgi:hypothetical protein